jgi:anaerobic dimethyl sulfoxide reductase subunit B (iron-sulfur subunit)
MNGAGFVLDLGRCVGCGACVLACRLKNRLPAGTRWRRVLPLNLDRRPGGPTYHFSLACHHCERPACLAACPSGAYRKRADGLVLLDGDRCIGCRYCEMACSFGAPGFDVSTGVMTKCDLCRDRIDSGALPACVAACPTEALLYQKAGSRAGRFVGESSIPGFVDPADCSPCLRFIPPRGARRARLFERLNEVLGK